MFDLYKSRLNKTCNQQHGQSIQGRSIFRKQVTFSTKICHISFVNKNNHHIGRRPREQFTTFKNSKQWETTQMQNLILYINLIASHFLMYERSSTAPPPYLYRVLLEIHMSFTEPSERNSNSPLALQRAWPRACVATTDRTIRQSFFTGVTSSETRCSEKCENTKYGESVKILHIHNFASNYIS